MSAASASSRWAASVFALSLILRLAIAIAAPDTAVVRLPYVPPAHRRIVRVAVDHVHVVHRDAELPRENLGEGRLLSLTVRRGTDHHVHLAGRVEPHDCALPQTALEAYRSRDLRWTKPA